MVSKKKKDSNTIYFHEKEKDRRVLLSPHIAHVDEILKKRKKKKRRLMLIQQIISHCQ